jgi:hypothetical protein
VIFEPGKEKDIFLDISSTNIDTPVPLLYQCDETRSIEVFLTVVFCHFSIWSGIIYDFRMSLREFIVHVLNRFT